MIGFWVKNRREVKDIKQVVRFLQIHIAQLYEKSGKVDSELFDVTAFTLFELVDIYESLATLLGRNHFRSCLVLARSIFENSINLQYIYRTDSERRARNYRLFTVKDYLKRTKDFESEGVERLELIKRMREEMKDYAPSGNKDTHWDGKNLFEIAQEIDAEHFYDLFKQTSNFSHSKFRGNFDFAEKRPYLDFLRDLVTLYTVYATLESLKVVAVKLDLPGGIMLIDNHPSAQHPDVLFGTRPDIGSEEN